MAVRKSPLALYPDSVLYKQFIDPKWQSSSRKRKRSSPQDWDKEQVVEWARNIEGLSSDVSDHFSEVTGRELDIRDLGVRNAGFVALLAQSIQKLCEEVDDMSAYFIQHNKYCFGKVIDHMLLKEMSAAGLTPAPSPPIIRDGEMKRFKRLVDFFVRMIRHLISLPSTENTCFPRNLVN